MATLQIEFKNGKFISHNGVNVESATDTYIKGNGWVGEVDEKGNIVFYAIRYYNKGVRHQLKFKIVDGYAKKTLRIGNEKPKVLKSYKMEKWPIDGIIGLTSGYVDERIVYFRTTGFQDFLNQHGLTAVRFEPSNGIFALMRKYDELHHICLSEDIESDGRIKELCTDNKELNVVEVADASWTVKTVCKYGKVKNRILYTLDNPKEIVGLPIFE